MKLTACSDNFQLWKDFHPGIYFEPCAWRRMQTSSCNHGSRKFLPSWHFSFFRNQGAIVYPPVIKRRSAATCNACQVA